MWYQRLHIFALGLLPMAWLTSCGQQAGFSDAAQKNHENRRSALSNGAHLDADARGTYAPGEDPLDGDLEPSDDPPGGADGDDPDGYDPDPDDMPDPDGNDPDLLIREMSFPSSREQEGELRHDLETAYIDQELSLQSTTVDKSQQFTQQPRPAVIDEFEQGRGDEDITETFSGISERPLDILLVLDNGQSMKEEARQMPAKLEPLLAYIEQTNWQIGVVTTDPNQTCLRALIKKGDTDARTAFLNAVNVGTSGSNNPRGLYQAVRSLSGECLPSQWIRDNSAIEVMVVSDKDNCSNGQACPGKDYAQASYLYNYLASIRNVGKNARFHGVFMPRNVEECDCPTAKYQGKIYQSLVSDTGGAYGNICNQNYGPALQAINGSVNVALRRQFTLRTTPVPNSLKVLLNGVELSSGFSLTGRLLELAEPLGDGMTLQVVYRNVVADPKKKFTLRYEPYNDSVSVTVNGVSTTAYQVLANPPAIEFTQAPALGARISIAYQRNVPLQTAFKLDGVVRPNSLSVMVNGASVNDYTFDASSNTVRFANPPEEGALINFAYTASGAPILRYPLALGPTPPTGLQVLDALTLMPIGFSYQNGALEITAADFAEGRIILVRYPNPIRGTAFTVTLPREPLPGSVRVFSGTLPCSNVTVQGSMVLVDGCNLTPSVSTVVVSYRYVTSLTEFTFNAPNLPAPSDFQLWTVWVNGTETMDYTRSANVFRFANELPIGSVVRIRLIQRVAMQGP